MSSVSLLNRAINAEQANMDVLGKNAASNAADIDQKVGAGPSGNTVVSYVRAEDASSFKAALLGEARLGLAEARNDLFQKINEALGDPHGGSKVGSEGFEDAGSINHLFTSMLAKLDVSDVSAPQARESAVNAVQSFLSSVATYQNKLDTISGAAESKISEQVQTINSMLKELYQNNSKITFRGTREDNDIISRSEDTIHSLSRLVNLNAAFSKGRISARGSLGIENLEWVNADSYVQLSYNQSSADKIKVSVIDGASGSASQVFDVEIRDSDGKTLTGIGGGLQGVLTFRDTDLVAAKKDISDTMDKVAFALNKMHNEGTGFPPASLVSAATVFATDAIQGSGSLKIAAFQASGQPLASAANSGGGILPIGIDIGNTKTVSELAAAINKEAICASQQGAALGNNVDSVAGKYLVSQAALDLTDIDSNGVASFGMRLESGSDHDVQFRFKNVVINDNVDGTAGNFGALINTIPSTFQTLKAGEILNTDKIAFNIPAAGARQELHIFADVEVIGADGTFAVERVHYTIDSGAANGLLGFNNPNYLQATDPAAPAVTWPGAVTGANAARPVARTNRAQVIASVTNDNKLSLAGRIAIMPDATSPAMITDSDGISRPFALHYGLNNLMNKNSKDRYEIRSDIVSDPSLLAWSKPQRMANVVDQNTIVGVNTATGTFTVNPGNAADDDTLIINGETMTFKTGAGGTYDANNPRHVLVQGTQAGTITELVNRINTGNLPAITGLVTVSANGISMDITAIRAGTKGNTITLVKNGGSLAVSGATMANGTNAATTTQRSAPDFRFVLTQNENAFASAIHSAVKFADGNSMSVKNAFEFGFLIKASSSIKSAESDQKVSEAASEAANKIIQDKRKEDFSSRLMKVMNSSHNMQLLASIRALIDNARKNNLAAMAA